MPGARRLYTRCLTASVGKGFKRPRFERRNSRGSPRHPRPGLLQSLSRAADTGRERRMGRRPPSRVVQSARFPWKLRLLFDPRC